MRAQFMRTSRGVRARTNFFTSLVKLKTALQIQIDEVKMKISRKKLLLHTVENYF